MPEDITPTTEIKVPKAKSTTAVLDPSVAEPEYKTEDPYAYVVWSFKHNETRNNAPINLQYPPTDRAKDILADINVPKGMSSLPLTDIWINFGPNQIPLETARAIQSHRPSAEHLERLIKEGVLEILTPDRADIEGIANDTAMSIHFTPEKAKALIKASYDKAELELWHGRESQARPEIARAIKARLEEIKNDELESLRSAERAHVETV